MYMLQASTTASQTHELFLIAGERCQSLQPSTMYSSFSCFHNKRILKLDLSSACSASWRGPQKRPSAESRLVKLEQCTAFLQISMMRCWAATCIVMLSMRCAVHCTL